MTHDEKLEIESGIISGVRMMLQKAQEISRIKPAWTIAEAEQMSDILKNVSCTYENYAKANHYLVEHSTETF